MVVRGAVENSAPTALVSVTSETVPESTGPKYESPGAAARGAVCRAAWASLLYWSPAAVDQSVTMRYDV
jgi:hypothetical protein